MKAKFFGRCTVCHDAIELGDAISKYGDDWVHADCRAALVARQQTLDGVTFRGTPPKYRRRIKRGDY